VSHNNDSYSFWSFETKDGQRNRDHLKYVREIQPDQVAKVVMSIGKHPGDNSHHLRMLEFYGFDGQRIGDAFGYKDDTDKKIEFELKKGDRLIGFKRSDGWYDCSADFQFIIGRK
jgi:desulfoferrodoxin (superoxide reductase-like protein)